MVGGIVITHGLFAEGICQSVEMIAGKQEELKAISLKEGDGMEQLMEKLAEVIKEMNCDKIFLFCDLFGATPCNVACMMAAQMDYDVIAGVNLPILLEFVMGRVVKNYEELKDAIKDVSKEDFHWITKNDLIERSI